MILLGAVAVGRVLLHTDKTGQAGTTVQINPGACKCRSACPYFTAPSAGPATPRSRGVGLDWRPGKPGARPGPPCA
jgi:hypothetical protein